MNHIVPDFESEDQDYLTPEFHKKSTMGGDEDIMELLWQNGQVVMQSQNQRSLGSKKPPNREIRPFSASSSVGAEEEGEEQAGPSDLFMQEDEMSAWLHYPIDANSLDECLYNNDLLYPTPPPPVVTSAALPLLLPPPPPSVAVPPARPPVPPFRRAEGESGGGGGQQQQQQQQQQPKYTNFLHFSRPNNKASRCPSSNFPAAAALRPQTEEASTLPSEALPESRAPRASEKAPATTVPAAAAANTGGGAALAAGTSSAGRELETCDLSVTSSPGTGGSGSAGMEPSSSQKQNQPLSLPLPPPPADDRKRKGRDTDDTECHSEDVEFEYPDAKKQSHGATSTTKRSRAAEVHNLSERRRRDRINEKMKALQELIPRCNKSDKASMLDEAIKYLKSLQMQVQMMSMGCSMVPMMFPGVQQYMPPMAMGMGMDMGMNRTMVPYPAILPGSSLPNPAAAVAAAAQLGQRFPVPGLSMSPPVAIAVPATSQAVNMSAPMMSSFPLHSQNQPRPPNFADPFQQYVGLHQTQLPIPQNQGGMPPIATKPSTSKDHNNQTG